MGKKYFIPSIQSSDFSNFHIIRTQATCDTGILNNETLQTFSPAAGGCGIANGNLIQFCLSADNGTLLASQAEGLTVNTFSGSFQITACGPSAFTCQPGDQSFTCQINGSAIGDCVVSLACSDGTVLTTCTNPGCN